MIAHGRFDIDRVMLESLEAAFDWRAFEGLLRRPGPWLGAFDFPFGLPREAVAALGWPAQWPKLVEHCAALGRSQFREQLDDYRRSRPFGSRYAHRQTDWPARSHSPLKLVNPPVGLMFFEGAQRLLAAGVKLPGMHAADPQRIAVEAYPALLARSMVGGSYKSDARAKQTPAREQARRALVDGLLGGRHPLRLRLTAAPEQLERLIADPRGDTLDATLALVQAAWCARCGEPNFGLPPAFDALEGWIATARWPA